MILREFAGTNQGPNKFAQAGFPIAALREDGFQLLRFVIGWWSAERSEVKLFEDVLVGCAGFEQLREAAVRAAEAINIGSAGENVQSLAEIRLVVALRNSATIG